MTQSPIPSGELEFQLNEVLDTRALCQRTRFQGHTPETLNETLNTACRMASDVWAPGCRSMDQRMPELVDGQMAVSADAHAAWQSYREAGFLAARETDEQTGRAPVPETTLAACHALLLGANPAAARYPLSTASVIRLLRRYGSGPEVRAWTAALLDGSASAAMAMTEPQAGSSPGDIRTTAIATDQGHHHLRGGKLFVSAGAHDLTNNVVYLVLARVRGAPDGEDGLSLFLVPRLRTNQGVASAEENGVQVTGQSRWMGQRGAPAVALALGVCGECHGYRVGPEHQGMSCLLEVLNEELIETGLGATALACQGYQHSLTYARSRHQGRRPGDTGAENPPLALVEHADVRRLLLAQKAFSEGALALCLYGARLVDDQQSHPQAAAREEAGKLLDLLSPVIKAWPSEHGCRANDMAIQVFGGAGYSQEYPVEQCWRDNRAYAFHPQTDGLLGKDLLGRQIWQDQSHGLQLLMQRMQVDLEAASSERCQQWALSLSETLQQTVKVIQTLGQSLLNGQPERPLANAGCFLHLFGHVVVAWMWLRQANVAEQALSRAESPEAQHFYRGKLQAAQYFFHWELPTVAQDLVLLRNQDDTCLTMKNEWF